MAGAGWQLLLGSVPMGFAMLAQDAPFALDAGAVAWLAALYTTAVALVVCYAVWMRIIRLLPAHVAALSTLLIPVIGVISSALLLGEPLGARELLATAAIVGALALVLPIHGRLTARHNRRLSHRPPESRARSDG